MIELKDKTAALHVVEGVIYVQVPGERDSWGRRGYIYKGAATFDGPRSLIVPVIVIKNLNRLGIKKLRFELARRKETPVGFRNRYVYYTGDALKLRKLFRKGKRKAAKIGPFELSVRFKVSDLQLEKGVGKCLIRK